MVCPDAAELYLVTTVLCRPPYGFGPDRYPVDAGSHRQLYCNHMAHGSHISAVVFTLCRLGGLCIPAEWVAFRPEQVYRRLGLKPLAQQKLKRWLAFCDSQGYIHLNSGKTGLHPQTSIGILDGPRARFFVPNIVA